MKRVYAQKGNSPNLLIKVFKLVARPRVTEALILKGVV